ncbi:MAG: 30S ribosome-binding factor RbfA [Armatimonadetes bacterium]|nr:30S ribosome-binding factor RbfA [Armatimonadota bacterium]
MPTQRQTRMARRVQEELSRILLREIDDPLVRLVTITDVELSPDLKHARVFFSVLGGQEDAPDGALRGLRRAARHIRYLLAQEGELRYTPSLDFRFDPTAQRAQRIEAILHRLHEEGGLRSEGSEEPLDGDSPEANAQDDE